METEAIYYDGLRPQRQNARLVLATDGLKLSASNGPFFRWSYDAIRLAEDGGTPLRFHREQNGARTGEHLDIEPGPFTDALRQRCPDLKGGGANRRTFAKIAVWSSAILVLLGALIFYGVPALAARLAVMVPWNTEVAIGTAVEGQILRELGGSSAKICASGRESKGNQALDALVSRLSAHARLPGALDVKVLDSPIPNAFALPGGKIVLMRGLIDKAEGPDEVAGVLAHEMGHVANRDAMRGLIHTGGISFLVGMLLGDFTGAGALVVASRYLLTSRYSRENEAEADTFAIDVMTRAGADVQALGRFLQRIANTPAERELELLLTHPVTADRVAEIERRAPSGPRQPVLSQQEWLALRSICRD